MITPKTKVPSLELPLINGARWELSSQKDVFFTMIVFYRGYHCPICKTYLEELSSNLDDFTKRNVNVVAISADSEERAEKTGEEWDIPDLPIAYDMKIEEAREWGLFISKSISDKEPKAFFEPAVFLVKENLELYASAIQTMPFARPGFDDIINALDYIKKNDYPARGGE